MYEDLHALLLPILRYVLADATLPRSGLMLDLACGAGEKLPLLREALGPDVRLLGLDIARPRVEGGAPSVFDASSFVCGDAHALPLCDGRLDGAVCIAALGLFADRVAALRELRRVLRPGARVLIVTAEQRWALVTRWPPTLAVRLAEAVLRAPPAGCPQGVADAAEDAAELLRAAGFRQICGRGFVLEGGADVALLELPLVPWPALRPHVEQRLSAADLARCDAFAPPDVELVAVAVAALATA